MTTKAAQKRGTMTLRKIISLTFSLVVFTAFAVTGPGPLQGRIMGKTQGGDFTSVIVKSDRPAGRHLFNNWYVVETLAETEMEAVRRAKELPGVIYAEPDARLKMHQAACPPAEWYVENLGQFGAPDSVDVDTDAWEAWEILHTRPPRNPIRIAIVDSGVNNFHLRFKDVKFYARQKLTEDNRSVGDVYGHGTTVAGVVTAMLENPSWYEMGSYRVFDEFGDATYSAFIAGLQAAAADGSRIINFSAGSDEPSEAVRTFLSSHPDILFVFSAGNDRGDKEHPDYGQEPEYPARYHGLPNVVSVAAHDQSGALTRETNLDALLAAPGQYIFTSMNGCETEPMTLCEAARYGFRNGTSYSAPIVSAVCAGRMLMHPEESASQIRTKLLASVDVDRFYRGKIISGGRVNFEKLLQAR